MDPIQYKVRRGITQKTIPEAEFETDRSQDYFSNQPKLDLSSDVRLFSKFKAIYQILTKQSADRTDADIEVLAAYMTNHAFFDNLKSEIGQVELMKCMKALGCQTFEPQK